MTFALAPSRVSPRMIAQLGALVIAAASAVVCPYTPMVIGLASLSAASRIGE